MCLEIIYLIYMYGEEITRNDWYAIKPNQIKSYILICMYQEDLALNNLQWLICHKTQPNQSIYI